MWVLTLQESDGNEFRTFVIAQLGGTTLIFFPSHPSELSICSEPTVGAGC